MDEYTIYHIIIVGRVLQEIENLDKKIQELLQEYEERTKNSSYSGFNFGSSEISEFYQKNLNNAKKWFNQAMKDTVDETIDKLGKWHFDIQKNFDTLKF
jgi:hypothetical protein